MLLFGIVIIMVDATGQSHSLNPHPPLQAIILSFNKMEETMSSKQLHLKVSLIQCPRWQNGE